MTEILIWPMNVTEKTLQETDAGESAQLYIRNMLIQGAWG